MSSWWYTWGLLPTHMHSSTWTHSRACLYVSAHSTQDPDTVSDIVTHWDHTQLKNEARALPKPATHGRPHTTAPGHAILWVYTHVCKHTLTQQWRFWKQACNTHTNTHMQPYRFYHPHLHTLRHFPPPQLERKHPPPNTNLTVHALYAQQLRATNLAVTLPPPAQV